MCETIEKAQVLEHNLACVKNSGITPEFLGRLSQYIVMEWIPQSQNLSIPPSDEQIKQIGKAFRTVHSISHLLPKSTFETISQSFIDAADHLYLSNVLDKKAFDNANALFRSITPNPLHVSGEYLNFSHKNTIQTPQGIVLLSDEESFCSSLTHTPLTKAVISWFSADQERLYWKSYDNPSEEEYFQKNRQFLFLYTAILWAAQRSKRDLEISPYLHRALNDAITH